jgi:hypothetical protein
MTDESAAEESASTGWRSLVGLGGAVSLCCLFATPAGTGAVGTTVAGGTTAALGGGVVRILVSAVAVGAVAAVVRMRTDCGSCAE